MTTPITLVGDYTRQVVGEYYAKAVSVRLTMLDGTVNGILHVDNANWPAQVYVVPKNRLDFFRSNYQMKDATAMIMLLLNRHVVGRAETENLQETLNSENLFNNCTFDTIVIINRTYPQLTRLERMWLISEYGLEGKLSEMQVADMNEFAGHCNKLLGCLQVCDSEFRYNR